MYSIDHLFRECNIKNRTLDIELYEPVSLEGEFVYDVCMLKVKTDETSETALLTSFKNGINTNVGIYPVIVSDKSGNPFNPQIIKLDIETIKEIWER